MFDQQQMNYVHNPESSCQVISLNLSTNSITSEGFIPLFRALKFNETLIDLDISSKT